MTPPRPQTPSQPLSGGAFLKEKLAEAVRANPRYSLRAFALKLGLSPSGLSQILSGKKKISVERAHSVARTLNLSGETREQFLLLVQIDTTKDAHRKAELTEQLGAMKGDSLGSAHQLALDQFRLISEWYGPAILEVLSAGKTKVSDAGRVMAARFSIGTMEASGTIDRLERLELIERSAKGFYVRVVKSMLISSGVPSDAIRKYVLGVAEQLQDAIKNQSPQQKSIGTEVFLFDPTQLPELKKLTNQYLNSIQKLAQKGKNPSVAYQAIASAFSLEERKHSS